MIPSIFNNLYVSKYENIEIISKILLLIAVSVAVLVKIFSTSINVITVTYNEDSVTQVAPKILS
ncbi:hypothetical protein D3C76_1333090 [compost metagenome]